MAAEYAPAEVLDKAFGISMPLPIAPVYLEAKQQAQGEDDHHRLFHSDNELLRTSDLEPGELDERRVPRWAGLQYGSRWLHTRYHRLYPDGVKLPVSDHEGFALSVLFSAGYVPTAAIDVHRRRPRIIRVDDEIASRLQEPGILHQQRDRHWAIGWFFGKYILRYGLQEVIESDTVAQFIDEATPPSLRLRLGFRVISKAAEIVLDPLEPIYQSARQAGKISPETPETARRFLMKHFDSRQPDYFEAIRNVALAA